ncbi:MAG: CoB--CoM heterodisulfide reductase iron-sulfur subunit A family protein, partial [Deltaproteobacteria bacterium]|nr:CoB--CoM heterodisulfide reductase iron-sulfur subunit A family protein [Deltaproteobacteria bacterium]
VDQKPAVSANGDGLRVEVLDQSLGQSVETRADLVVLASAIVPPGNEKLAQLLKVPLNEDGFYMEAHAKLGPSDFPTEGVFLCGMAHYPKPIDESIAQALAASSRAVTLMAREKIQVSGTVAYVNPSLCSGCQVCIAICPYSAPSIVEEGPFAGKAEINPVLCKGCGLCVTSCRSGALNLRGFEEGQILAMIDEL